MHQLHQRLDNCTNCTTLRKNALFKFLRKFIPCKSPVQSPPRALMRPIFFTIGNSRGRIFTRFAGDTIALPTKRKRDLFQFAANTNVLPTKRNLGLFQFVADTNVLPTNGRPIFLYVDFMLKVSFKINISGFKLGLCSYNVKLG